MRLLQQAEQVAREVVADRPDITLKDLELTHFPTGPVLVASIESTRAPGPARIARLETLLRERLAEPSLSVVVRVAESVDITSKGRVLFGEAHFGAPSAEEAQQQKAAEEAVRASLQALASTFVTAIDAVRRESGWAVRADVVAPRVPSPADVHDVEARAGRVIKEPVELTVRASTDVLVTGTQYRAAGDVLPAEQGAAPEAQSP
jgi:hypothetical protein